MNRYILAAGLAALSLATAHAQSCAAIDLQQNWTAAQSEAFWFTSQGSRLMPYAWFLALEVSDTTRQTLLRDPSNMDRYGYISVPPSPLNPDGLPIGFVKDTAAGQAEAIGFTCAACHTGSLKIRGQLVIVEGGPALSDFWLFLGETVAALRTAESDTGKFARFSVRVLRPNPSQADVQGLRVQMKEKLADLETRVQQNMPSNPNGYGRVDAFGHILTRVLGQVLKEPANAAPPYAPERAKQAPVSYPFLWDTPQHDVVQWNGAAPNTKVLSLGPLGRNVGEVLGVFGELEITPGRNIWFLPFLNTPPQFKHSAKIANLHRLEEMVRSLWSPVWPKGCLPQANAATIARGRAVYTGQCAGCHRLLGEAERKDPNREITAILKPLGDMAAESKGVAIHTDPTMAMNFAQRRAKTGPLKGAPNLIKFSPFGPEATGHEILLAAVNGVLFGGIDGAATAPVKVGDLMVNPVEQLRAFRSALEAGQTPRYKARPLNGIWATAPYLHNGSVPTLWDLLQPTSARPQIFHVGSRDFDPQKVGLVTQPADGTFIFNTSPQGNWRNGHEFGTSLPENQKRDLLEFLKTL